MTKSKTETKRAKGKPKPMKEEVREVPFGEIDLCLPYMKSGLTPRLRLNTRITARQGRALRGVFEGFQDTSAKGRDGRPVSLQDDAVRLLLDMIADKMGL